jgi:hypothetical protein
MNTRMYWRYILFAGLLLGSMLTLNAQSLLDKNVPLNVNRQRLENVLEILSNKGNFYFSYNSNIIKKDSLVTLSSTNKSVQQILQILLPDHYEFLESGNYIIIRKEPIKVTVVTQKAVTDNRFFVVSGYVLDNDTYMHLPNASIYEKAQLASALTNSEGYFKLRLKQKTKRAELTVSKEFYQDTSVVVDPGYNQQVTVTISPITSGTFSIISPEDFLAPDQLKVRVQKDSTITEYTYTKTDSSVVEQTGVGRFLLSATQKVQSINLKNFFTSRPFQLSLTPGLSTQGKLSSQVINNASLNVFGGYTGGVNGAEIGGLFNINKKYVQYFQAAGLFNIAGGHMHGFQVAGIHNTVLDSVEGFQAAGITNYVTGHLSGFQVSGIYNHVGDSLKGFQTAGVANYALNKVSGVQVAGVINFANREMRGAQIAGVINYAKNLKGLQIGVINIADTSDGFSIGLINIILKGYHKFSLFSNEVATLNGAFKTGNSKLYSILQGGLNVDSSNKIYTFGYGLGSERRLSKVLSLNPEITAQYLYLGSWDYLNLLSKAHLNLNIRLGNYVSLFVGPTFNVYYSDQDVNFHGYRTNVPPSGFHTYDFGTNVKGWLGWTAGINFF